MFLPPCQSPKSNRIESVQAEDREQEKAVEDQTDDSKQSFLFLLYHRNRTQDDTGHGYACRQPGRDGVYSLEILRHERVRITQEKRYISNDDQRSNDRQDIGCHSKAGIFPKIRGSWFFYLEYFFHNFGRGLFR
jgi:hypothetical protein